MKYLLAFLLAGVLFWGPAVAQRAWAAEPSGDALIQRLQRLESETQALRSELQQLRDHPVPLPPVQAMPVAASLLGDPAAQPAADDQFEYFTWDQLRSEMEKLAWTKGDYKIVPYGSLRGSAAYETERTFPGAYTLFVPSADDEGEDAFIVDTRRTRIGLNVTGPRVPLLHGARTGGKLEIDFHGAFVVENKPGVLLRHAYGEVKDDDFRLLAGQTWDVISPLYPHVLNYSVGWGGGNIGYRRAQVRLERYLHFSQMLMFTVEGSINQNIVSDFNKTAGVRPEASAWPLLETRVAATLGRRGKGCSPIEIGASGHFGEQGFDFTATGPAPLLLPPRDDARVRTWSVNADVRVPITSNLGFQGEFFTGENLSAFLGGIIQGVDLNSRRGIRTTGGWGEIWYDWTPKWHFATGFGIDDPRDNDLRTGKVYNQFIFANTTYDLLPKLNVGVEVTSWKTLHKDASLPANPRPGDSVRFEFAGKYNF